MAAMNRREFIKALGLSAAAVAFVPGAAAEPTYASAGAGLDEVLHIGDVFTIEGRYAVNPITRQATHVLQRFIVTSVSSDRAELEFHPSLKYSLGPIWPPIQPDETIG
jgi:hypothetical protein